MSIWKLGVGLGAVLLLAAPSQGADSADLDNQVAQGERRGSFGYRNFEGRFGDVDRPRTRPAEAAVKEGSQRRPEMRRREEGGQRPARPVDFARQKEQKGSKESAAKSKPKDGEQAAAKHRMPQQTRDGRPNWQSRWRPSVAGAPNARWGAGPRPQFAPRVGPGAGRFGGQFAAASWHAKHRKGGHAHASQHSGRARCALASMHGGKKKHGGASRSGHAGHRGYAQRGRQGYGRQGGHGRQVAHARHGQRGLYTMHGNRGHHNRYASAWGQRSRRGHHGQMAHRGHGNWKHRAFASRGRQGQAGRHGAAGRMVAMRWHHRGFAPGNRGQFGQQGRGAHGFAMNPWTMRRHWQGFAPRTNDFRVSGGPRPQQFGRQQFDRPWNAPVRPTGFSGRGPQVRGSGQGDRVSELSARLDRLQRELEQLRRQKR